MYPSHHSLPGTLIDAKMHYVHYPEEEGEDSESSGDDDDMEDEDAPNGGDDEEMEEEGEMYENPSNCNADYETDDENFGQDERRRRRKNYVMI